MMLIGVILANKLPIADDKNKFTVAVGSFDDRTKHLSSYFIYYGKIKNGKKYPFANG